MNTAITVSLPRRRLVVGLAWAALGLPAGATVDQPTAESLLRLSGLWAQLADVASQVRAGVLWDLQQRGAAASQVEVDRLTQAIDLAYSAQRLRSACLGTTAKRLDKAHVAALRRWFEGPTGSAITRLEVAQSGQDQRALLEQGAALLSKMPSSRRRILQEMVVATRVAELQTELTIGSSLAVAQGARDPSDAGAPSLRELKEALDGQRHQIMRAAGAQSLAAFAGIYPSLPDAELEAYLDFLKSPPGRHFVDVGIHAVGAALFAAAIDFGGALGQTRDKPTRRT